jgi:hypothetical protein
VASSSLVAADLTEHGVLACTAELGPRLLGWLALVASASALLDMASAGYGQDLVAVSFARELIPKNHHICGGNTQNHHYSAKSQKTTGLERICCNVH